MRITVTGAAGQIGQRVARALADEGHDVTGFDIAPAMETVAGRWFSGNLVNDIDVRNAIDGAQAVVHLGAISDPIPWERYRTIIDVNVVGTFNVLEAARLTGATRVVVASTINTIGLVSWMRPWTPDYLPLDEAHPCRPDDNYGATKLMAEIMARGFHVRHGLEVVCLRFTGVFFPDSPASVERYRGWINAPDGELVNRLWSYLRSEDAIEAIQKALISPGLGFERILLAAPDSAVGSTTLRSLVERHFPQRLDDLTRLEAAMGPNASLVSTRHCSNVLGWRPTRSYRDGLRELIDA
jgi:UDP-glucose 4-epimerase